MIRLSGTNRLGEIDFSAMAVRIKPKYALWCFPQCYGGGFAERMGKGVSIGFSENSRSAVTYSFFIDGSAHAFIPVLFGQVSRDERKKADTDLDSIISVQEAFTYASRNDPMTQPYMALTPWKNTYHLYYQNANPASISFDVGSEK